MTMLTLPAYAKLNLTLDILGARPDGYHDLRTVMQSVSLHDDVTVALADGAGVVCRCGGLPGDARNLAIRAAEAFFEATGVPARGLVIDIEKRIPVRAGMAGGSSDAAAALRALRRLLSPELPLGELEKIGERVGSDVPYCVRGGAALAEGRGERLTSLRDAPRLRAVVCKPDFGVPTPELFARADGIEPQTRPDTDAMLRAIEAGDAEALCRCVGNVFEEVLPPECGEVFAIKERLLALGADAASMTGTGPAVFGLFRDGAAAKAAFAALRGEYPQTFLTRFV